MGRQPQAGGEAKRHQRSLIPSPEPPALGFFTRFPRRGLEEAMSIPIGSPAWKRQWGRSGMMEIWRGLPAIARTTVDGLQIQQGMSWGCVGG